MKIYPADVTRQGSVLDKAFGTSRIEKITKCLRQDSVGELWPQKKRIVSLEEIGNLIYYLCVIEAPSDCKNVETFVKLVSMPIEQVRHAKAPQTIGEFLGKLLKLYIDDFTSGEAYLRHEHFLSWVTISETNCTVRFQEKIGEKHAFLLDETDTKLEFFDKTGSTKSFFTHNYFGGHEEDFRIYNKLYHINRIYGHKEIHINEKFFIALAQELSGGLVRVKFINNPREVGFAYELGDMAVLDEDKANELKKLGYVKFMK